jgi:hypothetical protein
MLPVLSRRINYSSPELLRYIPFADALVNSVLAPLYWMLFKRFVPVLLWARGLERHNSAPFCLQSMGRHSDHVTHVIVARDTCAQWQVLF